MVDGAAGWSLMESLDKPTREGKSETAESVDVGRNMANEVVSCC